MIVQGTHFALTDVYSLTELLSLVWPVPFLALGLLLQIHDLQSSQNLMLQIVHLS